MPYLQIALPTALICWLAFWPLRGRARWLHVAMTASLLAPMILTFRWLWPSAYAPLGLLALLALAILVGRRRPVPRQPLPIWPGLLAATITVAGVVAAAGLVTARRLPTTAFNLAPPFAAAMAITEGGTRTIINRHREVLDADSPSLSGWRGAGYAITLQPVDTWGRPLTESQPVLAPCEGQILATGEDTRLGHYLHLSCSGRHIFLSGFANVTATGAARAGAPLGTALSLTLHNQTPGTTAHPFSGAPLWITLNGTFPVRGWVLRP